MLKFLFLGAANCRTRPARAGYLHLKLSNFFRQALNALLIFLGGRVYFLHGTHLDSSTELKPLKLEQAMYTKLSNDVSCLIDNKIIVLADRWKNTVCL
ncbi:hypothetical protein [Treponema parvum]|uniref:hypothetical protein n=1 Tax=Treponema parvum TaxID=138851 RepID=UPI003D3698CC